MADIWFDVDTALAEVPVNSLPLLDATDFKAIEDAVAFNAAGMALFWHFTTTGGAYTVTAVTPTSGGDYDWTDQGSAGVYTIEIPASGGASINNDTEGVGWFTGSATGVLPWKGPYCGFRAAALNDALIDGGTLLADLAAVLEDTGTTLHNLVDTLESELAKVPKSDSNVTWNATALASLQQEATDALNAYDPPTNTEFEARSIAAASYATAAELAKVPKSDGTATWNATALGSIQSEAADALNAYDPPTKAEMDSAIAGLDAKLDIIDDFIDNEVAEILVDTSTTLDDMVDDLEGRLTAALATALQAHGLAIGRLVVGAGSTTTEVVFSTVNGAAPSAVDDFYNGSVIVFTSGDLTLQKTDITDYDGGTATATVTALTDAPANTVTAVIT